MIPKETVEMKPNEKIENLNLIALRKYACAKINSQKDWYLKCVECPGLDSCRAGKRAVEIIENDTKPEKKNATKDPEIEHVTVADVTYIEALKQKDPVGYIQKVFHHDKRWRSSFLLRTWMKKHGYPEERIKVFYDYKLTDNEITDFVSKYRKNGMVSGEMSAKKALTTLEQVLAISKTPEEILINWRKLTGNTLAYSTAYRWANKYPELNKKYNLRQVARLCQRVNRADAIVNPEPAKESEEEDVSIEDFLSEMENETATDVTETPVDNFLKDHEIHDPDGNVLSPEEAKAVLEKKQQELDEKLLRDGRETLFAPPSGDKSEGGLVSPYAAQLVLQSEFGRKKQELRRRLTLIDEQILKFTAEKKTISEQMDVLDRTAELFGMRPTNVRNAQL